jgi:hypothetical protein
MMTRTAAFGFLLSAAVLVAITPIQSASAQSGVASKVANKPLKKGDPELKKLLTPLQFAVTQTDATETPFRNEYWDNHEEGIYVDVVLRSHSSRRTFARRPIRHCSWSEPKFAPPERTPTSDISSMMGRPRRDYATA